MAFYYELKVNKDKTVKLKMNTKNIIALEKSLGGKNPITVLTGMQGTDGDIQLIPYETVAKVLHYSLQALEHGYDYEKTLELIDEYREGSEDGKIRDYTTLIPVLMKVFEISGIIPSMDNNGNPNDVSNLNESENPTQVVKDL